MIFWDDMDLDGDVDFKDEIMRDDDDEVSEKKKYSEEDYEDDEFDDDDDYDFDDL